MTTSQEVQNGQQQTVLGKSRDIIPKHVSFAFGKGHKLVAIQHWETSEQRRNKVIPEDMKETKKKKENFRKGLCKRKLRRKNDSLQQG